MKLKAAGPALAIIMAWPCHNGLAEKPAFSASHQAAPSKTEHRELKQQVEPSPVAPDKAGANRQQQANEQYLWNLYRQGKLDTLQRTIDRLRQSQITPPAELLRWLSVARFNRLRSTVQQDQDWFAVIEHALRYPQDFSCNHRNHKAFLAHAWHELGYTTRAADAYVSIMDCGKLDSNARTLALTAIEDLPLQDIRRLADTAAKKHLPVANLLHFHWLRKSIEASRDAGQRLRLEAEARGMHTLPTITAEDRLRMADSLVHAGLSTEAAFWYSEYLRLAEAGQASRPLPESLFRARWHTGRKHQAISLLPSPAKASEHEAAIEATLANELFASFEAKKHQDVVHLGQALKARRKLTVDEQLVISWAYYHLGKRKEAEARFSLLYRETKDARALEGKRIASAGDYGKRRAEARWLYWHKEFLAARTMMEEDTLEHINRPGIALGLAGRAKTGAHPLEDMRIAKTPLVQASFVLADRHRFRLAASSLRLDAPAHLSRVPYLDQNNAGSAVPATSLRGKEWSISYERSGRWHPHVEASLLPHVPGMPASYRLAAGILHSSDNWHGDLTAFHRPYGSNALTYAGRLDATGRPWGQISATGVSLSTWAAIGDAWGASMDIVAEQLRGSQVLGNRHLLAQLGLGHALDWLPSDFMSIGPYLRYERFGHNASPFTLGHGGYFSPQQLELAGMSMDYLSPEAGRWVLRVHAEIGWQKSRSAATQLLPWTSGSRILPATSSIGVNYALESTAVARLGANLFAHGGLILRESPPSYRDIGLLLALEWKFGERRAAFSDDLMQAQLRGLFQ